MNNAVFGKLMENVCNRRNITLVQDPEKVEKLAAQVNYKSAKIFRDDLVAVERFKTTVTLNKPIYCGFCVLDLSKVLMYSFHYVYMKHKYPGDQSKLLLTDTDSLIYSIQTDNIYQDLFADRTRFDFSEYAKSSPYYDPTNKKVIGKMSDELKGVPMKEFVGLRSKLYSYTSNMEEVKKCKGISKSVVKNNIRFEHYKSCLFKNSKTSVYVDAIRSSNHDLHTVRQRKVALSFYDDKRYLLNNVKSVPFGHYSTM